MDGKVSYRDAMLAPKNRKATKCIWKSPQLFLLSSFPTSIPPWPVHAPPTLKSASNGSLLSALGPLWENEHSANGVNGNRTAPSHGGSSWVEFHDQGTMLKILLLIIVTETNKYALRAADPRGFGCLQGLLLWPLSCPLITIHSASPWSWYLPWANLGTKFEDKICCFFS
jgi:hypothetical protein